MAVVIAPVITYLATAVGLTLGATALGIISTAVALGISMAIASAFKPNLGEFGIEGQGQVLDTRKSNTNAVAVVYGENKLAGNIIWQTTNNYNGGTTNKDYWAIISMTDGAVTDFIDLYADEYKMDSTIEDIHTLDYQQVKTYDTSNDGINVSDVYFVTASDGTTVIGSDIFGNISVSTSSNPSDAGNITDGSTGTNWTPDTSSNEWILLVNNDTTVMHSVKINLPYTLGDYEYYLEYSDDDITWYSGSPTYTDDNGWTTIEITETGSHLYWRIYFTDISIGLTGSGVNEVDFSTDLSISISIPKNISYMAVHHRFDAENNTSLANITAHLKGRSIERFTTPSSALVEAYSNVPSDIIFDIMKETLNISLSDVNQESFYDARVHALANDLLCNVPFIEKQNTDSSIQAVLATMRAHLSFSNNEWVFIYDAPQSSVKSLTEDDIIENTLSISAKPSSDTANTITVRYINPDDMWQIAEVTVNDDDLVDSDGQVIEQILEVRGCTSKEQAGKLAQLTLNQMRYSEDSVGDRVSRSPLDISFTTTVKNAELEVGDVINITHDLLSYPRDCKLVSVETDQSGAIAISATEYCGTHYKYDDGTAIIT